MRHPFSILGGASLVLLVACSGGGGSSPAPQPAATLGGAGSTIAVNQKITFTIDVPAGASGVASRRRRPAVSAIATTPYVSPRTGSVLLTLAEINGISPQQAPPAIAPINIPPSCQGSPSGCTIPVTNVPAALGIDRYFVQTYTDVNATGTLISSGFVDVAVPIKANAGPSIGGAAALSIGGFVANIELAPSALNFVEGTASSAAVLVQALDAGGATIVGSAQYASPIVLTVNDTSFAIGGAPQMSIDGPLQAPLTLSYNGGNSFGALVSATSQNQAGVTVSATPIAVNILAPGSTATNAPPVIGGPPPTAAPTPIPTPLPSTIPTSLPTARPTPKPSPTAPPVAAMSLYVADAQSDTVSEYRIASQIAAGNVPSPAVTPSRVVKFDQALAKSPVIGGGGLSCNAAPGASAGQGTAGVAVDAKSGTIFLYPNCGDGTNSFIFGYPAQAVGSAAPTIVDPLPAGFGFPNGLATANNILYAGYTQSNEAFYAYPIANNGRPPTITLAAQGILDFANPPNPFATVGSGFGVDTRGDLFVPAAWNDTATGDAALFINPAAILTLPATSSNQQPTAFSAISGLNSSAGGNAPVATIVDSATSTVYALTGGSQITAVNQTTPASYWAGLSFCPPPRANAPVNTLVDLANQVTNCQDQQAHLYLAAYSLTSQLLGPNANGTDVDLIPNFIIGGDTVGKFGCPAQYGQFLAEYAGYVYAINLAPQCTSGSVVAAPEIDVYNTNGVSGAHTNIGPIFTLPLQTGYPFAITIGPSGSVSGGQALLRAPLSATYRPNLYGRRRPLTAQRRRFIVRSR